MSGEERMQGERCRRCGARVTAAGMLPDTVCPACLFALALGQDAVIDGESVADGDAPLTYRVLTVLAGNENRTTYLSEQRATRRLVTLEVVRADAVEGLTSAGFNARLAALMHLAHPGIARVLDGRLTAVGDFCVIAQYLPGPSIDCYCRRRGLAAAERLTLFSDTCRAIEYAHARGVIHGRLTPDLVVMTRTPDGVRPVITGFSVCSGTATIADDVKALEVMLRVP